MSSKDFSQQDSHDEPLDPGSMGFLDHLDELRTRIIRSLMAIGVAMGVAFVFVERISVFVLAPVKRALSPGAELVAGLTESFTFNVDLALIGGVILAAPFVTYQVWRFVAPGLYARERRLVVPLVLMAVGGTLTGAAFSHFILFPSSVEFLKQWLPPGVKMLVGLSDTFNVYKSMLLAMVAVFQVPGVVFLLARLGAVTARGLWRTLGYAVLIIFVVAAVITSTGDAWNLLFTATPMVAMYVLSIGIAWLATPRHGARANSHDASHALGLLIGVSIARKAWRRQRARNLRPLLDH